MLEFLLVLVIIYLVLRVSWRWVLPALLRGLAKRFINRMESDMRKNQNAHQQKYDPNYQQAYYVKQDMRIHVPRQQQRKPDVSEVAKDVDFEEV